VTRLQTGGAAFLAVPREWAVERPGADADTRDVTAEDLDPWALFGLAPVAGEGAMAVVLSRDGERMFLRGVGTPMSASAQRLCPTPPGHPVEIVRIDGADGLLLRPDALLAAQRRGPRTR